MAAFSVPASSSSVPLYLTVNSVTGGVSGLTPTTAIRLSSDPSQYLDFADDTFKDTGWTLRDATLSEIRRGHYQRTISIVDLLNAGLDPTEVLLVEYHVSESSTKVDAQDIVVISQEELNVVASGQPIGESP